MAAFARPTEPVENRLLAALPRNEYESLLPNLQQVSFSLGEVVYEFGWTVGLRLFPNYLNRLFTLHHGKRLQRRNGFDRQ